MSRDQWRERLRAYDAVGAEAMMVAADMRRYAASRADGSRSLDLAAIRHFHQQLRGILARWDEVGQPSR